MLGSLATSTIAAGDDPANPILKFTKYSAIQTPMLACTHSKNVLAFLLLTAEIIHP
jgi:hypothetical protein